MFSSKIILALAPFLPLISASPVTSSRLQARTCGTVVEPTIIQFINESSPTTTFANDVHSGGQVTVFQNVESTPGGIIPIDRVYTIIGFTGIPATAFGCQLNVVFPAGYPITTTPAGSPIPPLDIHTFGTNQLGNAPASGPNPNTWNWNTPSQLNNPPPTLFGTVTFEDGVTKVVNSAACPVTASNGASNTIAFTAQIASGVEHEAGVGYNSVTTSPNGVGLVGFFLTYDC